jgi:hypothetical protein
MMNVVQIDNWRDYVRDGEQFLQTANMAHKKAKKTFSNETLYNITCMAIEKLIMAFLMKNGDLAENHTMGDLKNALQRHIGDIGELETELSYLDGFQEICDLDSYALRSVDNGDILRILNIGNRVQGLLKPYVYDSKKSLH